MAAGCGGPIIMSRRFLKESLGIKVLRKIWGIAGAFRGSG